MRVVIAGAGGVGRSIARELLRNGHQVLLVDREADGERVQKVPDAEPGSRRTPARSRHWARPASPSGNVVVAATGDDKVNLVLSLLAKTEFGVPRTVGSGEQPQERVDVRRGLGCRRRSVDTGSRPPSWRRR